MSSKYSGFLVSEVVCPRHVKMPNGEEHELHFRKVSAKDFRRYQIDYTSDDDEKQSVAVQRLIQASLCEPDGKLALTMEEAGRLTMEAVNALFPHVIEVNAINKTEAQGNG